MGWPFYSVIAAEAASYRGRNSKPATSWPTGNKEKSIPALRMRGIKKKNKAVSGGGFSPEYPEPVSQKTLAQPRFFGVSLPF
jgi:hypothetical protein